MKIAIVTDSSAYMSKAETTKLGVTVAPLTVMFGEQVYFENETISSAEFYARMKSGKALPTTSQVTLGRMDEIYRELAAAGYTDILSIHLSGALSGMCASLKGFVRDYEGFTVHVVDSRSISVGLADQVRLAVRMVHAGKTVDEIVPVLQKFNQHVNVGFMVNDLKHLQRTGRLKGGAALIGNLLLIKPLLALQDGAIVPTNKERTARRALKHIAADAVDQMNHLGMPGRYTLIDANNPRAIATLREQIVTAQPDAVIEGGEIGPAVGVHTGEGVVGVFTAPDWQQFPIE